MEQDIKRILELLQKGVLNQEEAEKMINELSKGQSKNHSERKSNKGVGEKIGQSIDSILPKVKGVMKKGLIATADFSKNMADKIDDDEESVFDNSGMYPDNDIVLKETVVGETIVEDCFVDDDTTTEEVIDIIVENIEIK